MTSPHDIARSRTTTALLEGLIAAEGADLYRAAWLQFDQRYRPLLARLFRGLGFDGADAADLSQDTLLCFVRDYRRGAYDRRRGRLRAWLLAIARARAANHRRRHTPATMRDSVLDLEPGKDELEAAWEVAWRQHTLAEALERLHRAGGLEPATIRAFEATAIEGQAAAEVATELGVAVGAIYVARHRAMTRLRELVAQAEELFDADAVFPEREE
ncbi:MAG: sigma-70 family RNA polymerase sigma factor [Planctomycetota bacterium]